MVSRTTTIIKHWNSYFGEEQTRGAYWLELDAVKNRYNTKMTGDASAYAVEYTIGKYLSGKLPLERCLSLGCGEGRMERRMAKLNLFRTCDAFDVADVAIAAARSAA